MTAKTPSPASPIILGLLFEGGDPSACLIVGGRIASLAEEERFVRDKHATNVFPSRAAAWCLEHAGLGVADLDAVAVGWDAHKFPSHMERAYQRIRELHGPLSDAALAWQEKNLHRYTPKALLAQLDEHLFAGLPEPKRPEVRFVPHHFCHALAAGLMSGFSDAAVVTADGHGEEDAAHLWDFDGRGVADLQQWDLPHSLGWFYTRFTRFFGFAAHDGEGKLMGLAAYGRPDPAWDARVAEVLRLTGDERVYEVEPRFFFGETAGHAPYTPEWLELFGQPLERGDERLLTRPCQDLAFAVQDRLERAGLGLARRALELTGRTRLCVAGGSFMNCKMNGELARLVGFENLFALPLAGDNGISLGAALAVHQDMTGEGAGQGRCEPWSAPLEHLYLGPEYSPDECRAALEKAGLTYERPDDISAAAAALVAESRVVGWFQGRMEAGARALGNRSILGNPLDPAVRDTVNAKVKFRETWRPFCPSTTEEDGQRHFEYTGKLPYMIVACEARAEHADRLPSVVHCDNTVRVQTVSERANPRWHRLIRAFGELTGHAVVLNTSFNVKGEPIVNTPDEAVACFLRTGMDCLALGDFLVRAKP